jgi:hypothetical protein
MVFEQDLQHAELSKSIDNLFANLCKPDSEMWKAKGVAPDPLSPFKDVDGWLELLVYRFCAKKLDALFVCRAIQAVLRVCFAPLIHAISVNAPKREVPDVLRIIEAINAKRQLNHCDVTPADIGAALHKALGASVHVLKERLDELKSSEFVHEKNEFKQAVSNLMATTKALRLFLETHLKSESRAWVTDVTSNGSVHSLHYAITSKGVQPTAVIKAKDPSHADGFAKLRSRVLWLETIGHPLRIKGIATWLMPRETQKEKRPAAAAAASSVDGKESEATTQRRRILPKAGTTATATKQLTVTLSKKRKA